MKTIIKQKKYNKEFHTDEKCFITELSNTTDDPELSIAQARVEPGVTTRWHRLKGITERYCIISGIGLVEVGELPPQNVTTGDVVLIPPMCRQRITNNGLEDLILLALCTPRFLNEAYEDIEDNPCRFIGSMQHKILTTYNMNKSEAINQFIKTYFEFLTSGDFDVCQNIF